MTRIQGIRKSAAKRGYSRKWRDARLPYLAKHPSCVNIGKSNCLGTATVIDHIKDHKGSYGAFWDRNNWQPMCKHCHDVKTARAMVRQFTFKFDEHGEPTGGWDEDRKRKDQDHKRTNYDAARAQGHGSMAD